MLVADALPKTDQDLEILEGAVQSIAGQAPDLRGLETPVFRWPPEGPSL